MGWQFTINDFTSGSEVITTIQEPVGWDAVNLHLKRDEKGHGFFGFEDDTFSSLQYDSNGADILRNAYYNYGIQAKVQLAVTYDCANEVPDNLYLGTFDFTTFKDYTADRCYVECATLVSDAYFLFKNRISQQVDLDSLTSYDQQPVTQTITCNAIFDNATNQIRVTQLLNGLMPGSKIVITGSVHNNSTFTIASSKPDYSNVNADLAGGGSSAINPVVSATFDPDNRTISFNQLLNIAVGTLVVDCGVNFPAPVSGTYYNNSGSYQVLSVQQFFNYTRVTIGTVTLTGTGIVNTDLVAQSIDTCVLTGTIFYTSQPTSTIIQLAETLISEASVSITLTANWLKNNLIPYKSLSKKITLPSKVIEATSIWKQLIDTEYALNNPIGHDYPADGGSTFIIPSWVNVQSDIDETYEANMPPDYQPDTAAPFHQFVFFRQESLVCTALATLEINFSGKFMGTSGFSPTTDILDLFPPSHVIGPPSAFRLRVQKAKAWDGGIASAAPSAYATQIIDVPVLLDATNATYSYSGIIENMLFEPGDYLWIYFAIWAPLRISHNVQMLIDAGSYCKFTISSQCAETPCSVYLVNEAISRCAESYTNGEIQVYSDYFGRLNAQPVASSADGCGALACITNGLRIRGCVMPDGSSIPKFFTSLDEMFTALDCIHNIGMGMEADPHRTGKLRLRIEPYEWFFQNTILLTCQNIMNYTRETVPGLLVSTFKCGYQQFETWNNNGLYDIFGNRTYRTPLNHVTNELDKTCKWMASDYAIEFARRQFGVTSSDGRYDDSTFMLCLINKYQGTCEFALSGFLIETTGTIFNSGNSITISNTLANDGTYTITSTAPSASNPALSYVFISGHTFSQEFAPAITVVQGSTTYANAPAYFIGANGVIGLDTLDLFGAAPGDSIVLGNTLYNAGTFIIEAIYAPVSASQPGNLTPINFPMLIFPASALGSYGNYCNSSAVTITDTTNQFYAVEQGMKNGTNILSPDTVMNYRISPAHSAMRHYRNVITDRQYLTENLIFTGGTGNFYALGTIDDTCSPENDNISEGGNLSLTNFTTPDDGKPLFYPEIVKFEYPLSWTDFLNIQANPYGLIRYEHTNEGLQSGWLVDLQYHPYTGMAEFTLYPKI